MILKKLFFERYDYSVWSENKEESIDKEESADKGESVDLSDLLPLESDEEKVREEKGIKILTPDKLFTRLPLLLAQIKAGNNSKANKKVKSYKYYIFWISIIKSLKKFTTVQSSHYNYGRKYDCDRRSQNFFL